MVYFKTDMTCRRGKNKQKNTFKKQEKKAKIAYGFSIFSNMSHCSWIHLGSTTPNDRKHTLFNRLLCIKNTTRFSLWLSLSGAKRFTATNKCNLLSKRKRDNLIRSGRESDIFTSTFMKKRECVVTLKAKSAVSHLRPFTKIVFTIWAFYTDTAPQKWIYSFLEGDLSNTVQTGQSNL